MAIFKCLNYFLANGSKRFLSTLGHSKVRVRFAPSPTGDMHFGGFRTALYNFLYARKNNGSFIVRIEDTDKTRLVPEAQAKLEGLLHWAGLDPDESPTVGGSYGPYVQSERLDIYRQHVDKLVEAGVAYPCFCSDIRLQLMRKEAVRLHRHFKYDNRCRDLTPEEVKEKLRAGARHCIRFKLIEGPLTFQDIVLGELIIDTSLVEGDPVIFKSDDFPTYHLACVVDDHLMEISHVLRGIEWHTSTPKHLMLYQAFGWEPPRFAHLPLLLDNKGKKLSKRDGDMDLESFKKKGYFPLALINFAMTMGGGGFAGREQFFQMPEILEKFQLEAVKTSSSQFLMTRLNDINKLALNHYTDDPKHLPRLIQRLLDLVQTSFPKDQLHDLALQPTFIQKVLIWAKNLPAFTLEELVNEEYSFIWVPPIHKDLNQDQKLVLQKVASMLEALDESIFQCGGGLSQKFRPFADKEGLDYRKMMFLLRGVLSGLKEGPAVGEIMEILGKSLTLDRLQQAASQPNPTSQRSAQI